MLNSKTTGWMLTTGFCALVLIVIAKMLQGDQDGVAGRIAWAAANDNWQAIGVLELISGLLMIIFMVGFISWIKSISESNVALVVIKYVALLGVIFIWVGTISQMAGYETASENKDAAFALIKLSNFLTFIGIQSLLLSFFVVATSAYMQKAGTPALNVLLGLVGIVALVGGFIPWTFFIIGFPLAMLVLAIIGIQKVFCSPKSS
jgi:hypothetical protein